MNEINVDIMPNCRHCGAGAVVKFGTYKGVQRYWCKVCNRKFKADDTLFHMKTPANQISSALNMYYEGMSIKAVRRHLQQEYDNAPSTATIYEWIMKFTQYATDSIKDYKPKVGNIWIADETAIKIDGNYVWFWDIIDDEAYEKEGVTYCCEPCAIGERQCECGCCTVVEEKEQYNISRYRMA